MSGNDPILVITCPNCGAATEFSHAESAAIPKAHRDPFDRHPAFDVVTGRNCVGSTVTVASYFSPVTGPLDNIKNLPDVARSLTWSQWLHDRPAGVSDLGAFRCSACNTARRHQLSWPQDAYFQITYKDRALWARNRGEALKLLRFVESDGREKGVEYTSGQPWALFRTEDRFLRRVPTHFLRAKARREVARQLRRRLEMPDGGS